jgi:hypothetical protein
MLGTVLAQPKQAVPWPQNKQEQEITDAQVKAVGTGASNRLHAFDGEAGEVLFAGGGPEEQMSRVQNFQTPISGQRPYFRSRQRSSLRLHHSVNPLARKASSIRWGKLNPGPRRKPKPQPWPSACRAKGSLLRIAETFYSHWG